MADENNIRSVTITSDAQVIQEALSLLHRILEVHDACAVEAAVSYVAYVRQLGLDAESYPLFLRILEIENHWVLDALFGEADPLTFFDVIPPNKYVVSRVFRLLNLRAPGGIYAKTLGACLGILKNAYRDPRAGCAIYPITAEDVITLGKHLDSTAGQDNLYNPIILDILQKFSEYEEPNVRPGSSAISKQAARIRNMFFDNQKTLDMAIPERLMIRGDYRKREVHPLKLYIN